MDVEYALYRFVGETSWHGVIEAVMHVAAFVRINFGPPAILDTSKNNYDMNMI